MSLAAATLCKIIRLELCLRVICSKCKMTWEQVACVINTEVLEEKFYGSIIVKSLKHASHLIR